MVTSLLACLVLSPSLAEIKVQGEGLLRFSRDGRIVYAKSSKLAVSGGRLSSPTGDPMMPTMSLPNDTVKLEVTLEGAVTAVLPDRRKLSVGQIVLAQFANEAELAPEGSYLVARSRPKLVSPGEGTAGVIRLVASAAVQRTTLNETEGVKATPKAPSSTNTTKPAPAYKGSPIISFNAENEVSADTYRIGDVATVKADPATEKLISDLVLGTTPSVGIAHKINRSWVVAVLRRVNLSKDDVTIEMPETVTVRRPSQRITADDFVEAAIAYAKKQVPGSATFEGHANGPDYIAPVGKTELRGESFSLNNGSAEVTVGIYVDGKRRNSRTVILDARGTDGEALQKIASGTRVKIVVRSGGASIAVFGKTKSAAFVGQTVEAVSDNRTTHVGVLVDSSTVEVKI